MDKEYYCRDCKSKITILVRLSLGLNNKKFIWDCNNIICGNNQSIMFENHKPMWALTKEELRKEKIGNIINE